MKTDINENTEAVSEREYESEIRAALSADALLEMEKFEHELSQMPASQRVEIQERLGTIDKHIVQLIYSNGKRRAPHALIIYVAAALCAMVILFGITAIANAPVSHEIVSSIEIDAAEYENKLMLSLKADCKAYDGLPSGASAPENWIGRYYPTYVPQGYVLYDVDGDIATYKKDYELERI